ncbi:MAG: ATP-binding protein [Mucilaginibacter sp.]
MESIKSLKEENAALKLEIKKFKASENSEIFRTIFDQSRLPNKIISSDLKILQVNMALVKMLGYEKKEDIIGTRILDYSPPEHHAHWAKLQKMLWEQQIPFFAHETALVKKDKTMIWCLVTSIVFPDKMGLLGYTIIEDITEQHRLKRYKEEFISVASHELKTPITSLKANLQLMSRMLNSETTVTEKQIKITQNAEKHAIKLGYLVNDLLSTTKLEQGQLQLSKTTFILKELVNECCSHIRIEGKYHIDYRGSDELTVFADRHKIDQVLVNLVNNALKYAPESYVISINAEHSKGNTRVSVSDKGNGIAPENLAHLFDRYFRLSKDNNRSTGLGLGLYISREIVRLHGGEMGVESKLGKGATFWFTIPNEVSAVN